MKFNDNKITISKSEWLHIGKQAGWKMSQAIPEATGSFQFKVYENDAIFAEGVEASFSEAANAVEDNYFQSLENDARLNNEKTIEGYIYDEATNTTFEFNVLKYSYQEYAGASSQTDYKTSWITHEGKTVKEVRMIRAEIEADRIAQEAKDEYLRQRKEILESGLSPEEYRISKLEAEQAEQYDPQAGMEDDFRE